MSTALLVKVIQSGVSIIVGILALLYRKRLTQEITTKFKNVYGKGFNIEKVFDSKLFNWYLEFGFVLFGICAFIFAFFSIFGPINNW